MPRSSDVAGVLTMCRPQQARHERAGLSGQPVRFRRYIGPICLPFDQRRECDRRLLRSVRRSIFGVRNIRIGPPAKPASEDPTRRI